jgi:predicted DNA-binding transcriptional regulator AlpA
MPAADFIDRMVLRPEVNEFSGLSDPTLNREEEAGRFPKRYQLAPNRVGWSLRELLEWRDNLQRGPITAPTFAIKAATAEYARRRELGIPNPPRKRGRPRKHPLPPETEAPPSVAAE